MRTTIDISDALLKELRELAESSGRPFRKVVEEVLGLGLARVASPNPGRRFRVKPHPLGLKPGFHGVSLNQLYDQLEAEESAKGKP